MTEYREERPAIGPAGLDLVTRISDLQSRINALRNWQGQEIPASIAGITARRVEAELEVALLADDELHGLFVRLRNDFEVPMNPKLPAAAQELARRRALSAHERIAEIRARSRLSQA